MIFNIFSSVLLNTFTCGGTISTIHPQNYLICPKWSPSKHTHTLLLFATAITVNTAWRFLKHSCVYTSLSSIVGWSYQMNSKALKTCSMEMRVMWNLVLRSDFHSVTVLRIIMCTQVSRYQAWNLNKYCMTGEKKQRQLCLKGAGKWSGWSCLP